MTQEELIIKLTLDDSSLSSGLNSVSNTVESASKKTDEKSTKLSKAMSKVGKAAKAATLAAGAALVKVGSDALTSFADYEQLVGGVDTLFKDSSAKVQEYAANAFKTAGLSANEYMETVTSFSASLLQSVGNDTEQAAIIADMAITDMSDNANKMGTSMESIQNAYQGFAKQNYTMLDNLKLGYGGTKQEMERLLEDASKLSGVKYDISNLDDVYNAIHVIQTELGITGTTAKEASETIQGSVNSMKSAWQNLLTGLANEDADLSGLINSFVDSLTTVFNNVAPRIQEILKGIGTLVQELVPQILDMLPGIVNDVLPSLLENAVNIVMAIVNCIWDNLPMVVSTGIDLILSLVDGMSEALPELVPKMIEAIVLIIQTLLEHIPDIVIAAGKLIVGLAEGLVNAWPTVKEACVKLWNKLKEYISGLKSKMVEMGKNLFLGLAQGIANAVSAVIAKAKEACQKVLSTVKNFFGIKSPSKVFAEMGDYLMQGLAYGIKDNNDAVSAVEGISEKIENAFNPSINTSLDTVNLKGRITEIDSIGTISAANNLASNSNNNYDNNLIEVLAQFTRQIISTIEDKNMEVTLDGATIAKSVSNANNAYKRMTGSALIT